LDYDCKNPGGGGGWTLGSSPGVGGTRRPLQSGGPSAAAAVSTSGGAEASASSGAAAASVGGSVEASPGSGAVVASAGGGAEASPGGGAVLCFEFWRSNAFWARGQVGFVRALTSFTYFLRISFYFSIHVTFRRIKEGQMGVSV
jgi:hypothetical protein